MMNRKLNLSAFQIIRTGMRKPLKKTVILNCYATVEESLDPYALTFLFVAKPNANSLSDNSIILKMVVTEADLSQEINCYLNGKRVAHSCYEISDKIENNMSIFMKTGKTPPQLDLMLWIIHRSEIQLYFETAQNSHNQYNEDGDEVYDDYGGDDVLVGQISFGGFEVTEDDHADNDDNTDYKNDNNSDFAGFEYNSDGSVDSDLRDNTNDGGDYKIKTMKEYLDKNITQKKTLENTLKPTISATMFGKASIGIPAAQTHVDNFITRGITEIDQTGKEIKAALAERTKITEIDKVRTKQKLQKFDKVRLANNTVNLGVTGTAGTPGIRTDTGLFVSKDSDKKIINDILNNRKLTDLVELDTKKQRARHHRERQRLIWAKAPLAYPILRGKYQKGAFLGEGPLPSQVVHPFKFTGSYNKDHYYDTTGHKHSKHIAGAFSAEDTDMQAGNGASTGTSTRRYASSTNKQSEKTSQSFGGSIIPPTFASSHQSREQLQQQQLEASDAEAAAVEMELFKDDTKKALLVVKRACANIASYKLSLKQIFEHVDVEDEGWVPLTELGRLFKCLGIRADGETLDALSRYFDPYGTEQIHFYDFLWAFYNRKRLSAQWAVVTKRYSAKQIESKFGSCIDRSLLRNGLIDAAEFTYLLRQSFHMNVETKSSANVVAALEKSLGGTRLMLGATNSTYHNTFKSAANSSSSPVYVLGNDDSEVSILFNQFDRTGEGLIDILELRYFLDHFEEYKYLLHILEKTGHAHTKRPDRTDEDLTVPSSGEEALRVIMQQTQEDQRLLMTQQRLDATMTRQGYDKGTLRRVVDQHDTNAKSSTAVRSSSPSLSLKPTHSSSLLDYSIKSDSDLSKPFENLNRASLNRTSPGKLRGDSSSHRDKLRPSSASDDSAHDQGDRQHELGSTGNNDRDGDLVNGSHRGMNPLSMSGTGTGLRNRLYNHTTASSVVDDDYVDYYKKIAKGDDPDHENVYEEWMERLLTVQHDIESRLKIKHDIVDASGSKTRKSKNSTGLKGIPTHLANDISKPKYSVFVPPKKMGVAPLELSASLKEYDLDSDSDTD